MKISVQRATKEFSVPSAKRRRGSLKWGSIRAKSADLPPENGS